LGVKYEEALAALSQFAPASHGVWFEFGDARGHGYAQVDFLFTADDLIVVAEAKLTWTPAAYPQLRKLYFPLLQQYSARPVGGFVVCQNLTRDTPKTDIVWNVEAALRLIRGNPTRIPVLHLPLLTKESRHATTTAQRARVPSWWRKGQASPGTGDRRGL
jgi:hypothetical protein